MDLINRLREKPRSTKNAIAITTSAVVTLVIFGLWMSVFNFGMSTKPAEITAAVQNSETDLNPFSAFWSVLSKGWGGLMESINQAKSGFAQIQNIASSTQAAVQSGVILDTPATQSTKDTTPNPSSQKDVLILTGDENNGN